MIFAILPVKNPRNAKQRLAEMLDAEERETLARLLFRRTLGVLRAAKGIDRVVVITSDAEAARAAREAGAILFDEQEQVSHSVSADAACRRAQEMGASAALLVPIDVPLVTAADFSLLAASAASHLSSNKGPRVVVVPSMDGTGTNAVARTPPDAIDSHFGPGSCRAHLEDARSKGVPAEVLPIPGLMFDVDTPEDAAELLQRAPESDIARFFVGCGETRLRRAACASKSAR